MHSSHFFSQCTRQASSLHRTPPPIFARVSDVRIWVPRRYISPSLLSHEMFDPFVRCEGFSKRNFCFVVKLHTHFCLKQHFPTAVPFTSVDSVYEMRSPSRSVASTCPTMLPGSRFSTTRSSYSERLNSGALSFTFNTRTRTRTLLREQEASTLENLFRCKEICQNQTIDICWEMLA